MIKIIGHKSPDTDSTGSPIIWAWYKKAICGVQAQPKLLGEPNPEARFVLDYWQFEKSSDLSVCRMYSHINGGKNHILT